MTYLNCLFNLKDELDLLTLPWGPLKKGFSCLCVRCTFKDCRYDYI